jgi:hypothetical protein
METAMAVAEALEPGLAKSFPAGAQRLSAAWSAPGTIPTGLFTSSLDLEGSTLGFLAFRTR